MSLSLRQTPCPSFVPALDAVLPLPGERGGVRASVELSRSSVPQTSIMAFGGTCGSAGAAAMATPVSNTPESNSLVLEWFIVRWAHRGWTMMPNLDPGNGWPVDMFVAAH